MTEKKRVTVPAGPVGPKQPAADEDGILWSFGGESDERDVSKPVGYDEHGRPLYAPRGFRIRWPA